MVVPGMGQPSGHRPKTMRPSFGVFVLSEFSILNNFQPTANSIMTRGDPSVLVWRCLQILWGHAACHWRPVRPPAAGWRGKAGGHHGGNVPDNTKERDGGSPNGMTWSILLNSRS